MIHISEKEAAINTPLEDDATPYHTPDAVVTLARPLFTSYTEYMRWNNNRKQYLDYQRDILAAIVF